MLGRGLRDVIRVSGHTVANDFCNRLGTAGAGVLKLFKDQNARSLADHESVAVFVPGAAGFLRLIVA